MIQKLLYSYNKSYSKEERKNTHACKILFDLQGSGKDHSTEF